MKALCPACGVEIDAIPVVQRAELLRAEHQIMVNFEAAVVEHFCPDPREDRVRGPYPPGTVGVDYDVIRPRFDDPSRKERR